MRDLFGKAGRAYLAELAVPEPWNTTLAQSLELIGETEERIKACERDLLARALHDPYVPLLVTVPGIGLILGSIIAAELGDIGRFASAKKFVGYTGLCPFVRQSGGRDDRGPLASERSAPAPLGAHRGHHPRLLAPAVPGPLPAHKEAPRQASWPFGRQGRARPHPRHRDLAHAQQEQAIRPGRSRSCSGRLTTLPEMDRRSIPIQPCPPNEEAIER
jgi:hypothetical protein